MHLIQILIALNYGHLHTMGQTNNNKILTNTAMTVADMAPQLPSLLVFSGLKYENTDVFKRVH